MADFKVLFSNILNSTLWPITKVLAFQNPEFKILADFKVLVFKNPEFKTLAEFKILVCQNAVFKIFGDLKICPFQNTEFKIFGFRFPKKEFKIFFDFKI